MESYEGVLEIAIEAARKAAEVLRAEFERAGGPRGPIGKCPSDEAAEVAIRDHLRGRFPDWQFFGEETGTTGEASMHHWLVDPNDGTSSFQKGFRGSAVSIALLRGKEPVLGVVLAPCPPVGQEDLITWAEGCGPVQRNSLPAEGVRADHLSRESVILVSQDADTRSETNAQLADPARFWAVPSVAYRMALVAAGEGDAGVALSGAADYDCAGAHALLRGAGEVLLDGTAEPVRYAEDGGNRSSGGGQLIGGSAPLAKELSTREWNRIKGVLRDPGPLVRPSPAYIVPAGRTLHRAQGLWLGQLIGDALGAQVEFRSAAQIAATFPQGVRELQDGGHWNTLAGQPTDDSELALALARSLVEWEAFDREAVARAYAAWFDSDPFDMGGTIAAALGPASRAKAEDHPVADAAVSAARSQSQANGALMRISPLALVYHRDVDVLCKFACDDAGLTHPHPVCVAANVAFVAALAVALNGADTPEDMIREATNRVRGFPGAETVVARLDAAREGEVPVLDEGSQGWVVHAIQNAFYTLLHAESGEEGLVTTVGRGGDTDTNGAITGALLGAFYGAEAWPSRWRRAVLTCRPAPGRAARPRPRLYWPVDALHLAERLLALGTRDPHT
ncbi:MAG TPA: inositol monophosphatase family protein [Myxococcales bacterium LLY-WYZ-16_1]|nr:inositol monophosphatase family protein [Myxococcales bacterium LLY-WYZ-16_1]